MIQVYRLTDPNAADAPLHTRSAEFLKINPNGHIPSMDDDGVSLHEEAGGKGISVSLTRSRHA